MTRASLAALAMTAALAASPVAAKTLDVYEVDRSWKADARVYYDCSNSRAIRVRLVDRGWKADLRVYEVDQHWKADIIACR